LSRLPPADRRPGRHRLAVRAVGAVARGARRAGPDPGRRHGAGDHRLAVPGRRHHRPAVGTGAAARPAGDRARVLVRAPGPGAPMRGALDDLRSAHPLGATLPAVYREDPFTQQLCEAFDDVLSPVRSTVDKLPAYTG